MAAEEQSLLSLVTTFLADLARANHSSHTCRAYAADLAQLCAFHQGSIQTITADVLRAEKNGRGGPLRYQSMQERWDRYCSQAGVTCTLHQLRHTHATELINGGVSLPTIRKRLGHTDMQTTLCYAEQSDGTADTEVRAWRRQHPSSW